MRYVKVGAAVLILGTIVAGGMLAISDNLQRAAQADAPGTVPPTCGGGECGSEGSSCAADEAMAKMGTSDPKIAEEISTDASACTADVPEDCEGDCSDGCEHAKPSETDEAVVAEKTD